jgi:UDP-N-acetylglucosamine:LPS N-acetylglucosamine transferase
MTLSAESPSTTSPDLIRDRFPRVVIVSGSYGAGHDSAAREIGRRLEAAGCVVAHHDIVRLLPAGIGRLLRAAYFAQLRLRPDSWSTTLRLLRPGGVAYRLTVRMLGLAARSLALVTREADLVVSTHPFASQGLGVARRTGRLAASTVTYLTDCSVHPLWINQDVDLHLAVHAVAAEEARWWGVTPSLVRPLVPDPAGHGTLPDGVPQDRPYAVLCGGSLGIGELEEAADDVLATGLMVPVVLCGSNERLRARLALRPGVVALGWRTDLADLFAAAACVIQNSGGFMSLEALSAGAPLVTYRALPGHGLTNAENLERAGLAPWIRDVAGLSAALSAAAARTDSRLPSAGTDLFTALAGAPRPAGRVALTA